MFSISIPTRHLQHRVESLREHQQARKCVFGVHLHSIAMHYCLPCYKRIEVTPSLLHLVVKPQLRPISLKALSVDIENITTLGSYIGYLSL